MSPTQGTSRVTSIALLTNVVVDDQVPQRRVRHPSPTDSAPASAGSSGGTGLRDLQPTRVHPEGQTPSSWMAHRCNVTDVCLTVR